MILQDQPLQTSSFTPRSPKSAQPLGADVTTSELSTRQDEDVDGQLGMA